MFTLLSTALYWTDFSSGPKVSLTYVEYQSTDDVRITALLFKPNTIVDPLPGVVVVHGLTSYKENMNRLSVELVRHGFVVLAIDLRDHGGSSGLCTFGLPDAEPEDVALGVEFLRHTEGVDPNQLAIVGHSFGGMVALTAASKNTTQVNATVTWAAPTDLQLLERENHDTVAFVVDKRVLPPNLLEPAQLAVRSPVTYISNLRPNSVLYLHGMKDTLVPPSQAQTAFDRTNMQGQLMELVPDVDHAMDSPYVIERTIAFIELKTKGQVAPSVDPVYPSFANDKAFLTLMLALLNLPIAWLSWEFFCTKEKLLVRQYTYPANTKRAAGMAFGIGDTVIYGGIVFAVGFFVTPGQPWLLFSGVLPAPSLFTALLIVGAALAALAFPLVRMERRARGRDDKKFDEGENLSRSVRVVLPVLGIIALTALLQYALYLGFNWPHSEAWFLVAGLMIFLMFGFEAFLRLRFQRRFRGVAAAIAPNPGMKRALVNVIIGSVLFFAMVTWAMFWVFRGFAAIPGDAIALTIGAGLVSSLLYDRTKSILPGALFSGLFLAWALNSAFHF